MPAGMLWDETCDANAALMVFRDSLPMAEACVSIGHRKNSRPIFAEEGTGQTSCRLAGEAYHRLSPASAVWGNAAYTQLSVRQIRFADIIDYPIVGPYTTGDDTGGDMRGQRYEIGGGWSQMFGRWSVGIKAGYRAEAAHRSRDPRVRDIVSDLSLSAGGSLRAGSKWIVGISADFTAYNQDADVEFMNPANNVITQLYTGMENVYKRFGGNTVTESAHSLTAFGFGLQLLPAQGRGVMADITADIAGCDMYLRGYNNIKPAYTTTSALGARVSLTADISGNVDIAPSVRASVMKRRGTENLFSTAGGGNYAVAGSRLNYLHDVFNATITLPVVWHTADKALSVRFEPSLAVGNDKERLLSPGRMIEVRHLSPGGEAGIDITFAGRTMLRAATGCRYRATAGPPAVLGGLEADSPAGESTISDYEMLRARTLCVNAGAGLSHATGRILINVDIAWRYERYRHLATDRGFTACLSVNF